MKMMLLTSFVFNSLGTSLARLEEFAKKGDSE